MSNTITIVLPGDVDAEVVDSVRQEIMAMKEVEDSGAMTTRSLELATIMLWVSLAGDVLGLAGATATLIQKVSGRLRAKGIRGVEIELPNGAKISMDSASVEDIERILDRWRNEGGAS
jgi:hypothetical protein